MKRTVFICSNCAETWPDALVTEGGMVRLPAQQLAEALGALQKAATEQKDGARENTYYVQFEVKQPVQPNAEKSK